MSAITCKLVLLEREWSCSIRSEIMQKLLLAGFTFEVAGQSPWTGTDVLRAREESVVREFATQPEMHLFAASIYPLTLTVGTTAGEFWLEWPGE